MTDERYISIICKIINIFVGKSNLKSSLVIRFNYIATPSYHYKIISKTITFYIRGGCQGTDVDFFL